MSTLRLREAESGLSKSFRGSEQTPGFISHYNCIRGEECNSLKEIRHQQEGGAVDVKQPAVTVNTYLLQSCLPQHSFHTRMVIGGRSGE